MSIVTETNLPLPLCYSGKVRDTYDLGDKLLLIATDRISAFDSILPCGVPDKGLVLNQLSAFWFQKTCHIISNHLITSIDTRDSLIQHLSTGAALPDYIIGRSMIVYKAERIPIEAVVRGYISGSAWAEYKESGTVNGVTQPKGLLESQEFPKPVFTPTTKADSGHDMPINQNELLDMVGESLAHDLEQKSLAIYQFARGYAADRGIIIADTKFEFGLVDGQLILIDEILTPDSSRFWDAGQYSAGSSQPSFDKQPVRDWLTTSGWNKEPPAPMLPDDVIQQTSERYKTAYKMLVGKDIQKQS